MTIDRLEAENRQFRSFARIGYGASNHVVWDGFANDGKGKYIIIGKDRDSFPEPPEQEVSGDD